jgi:hypothetical protein
MSNEYVCTYHRTLDRYDMEFGRTQSFMTNNKGLAEYVSTTAGLISSLQYQIRQMEGWTPRMPVVVAGADGVPLMGKPSGLTTVTNVYQYRDIAVSAVISALLAHLKLSPYVDEAAVGHPVKFKKVVQS